MCLSFVCISGYTSVSVSHPQHHEKAYCWVLPHRAFILAQAPEVTALSLKVIHCDSQGTILGEGFMGNKCQANSGCHHPDQRCAGKQHQADQTRTSVSLAPVQGPSRGGCPLPTAHSGPHLHTLFPRSCWYPICDHINCPRLLRSTVSEPTALRCSAVSHPVARRLRVEPISGDDWFQHVCGPAIHLANGV